VFTESSRPRTAGEQALLDDFAEIRGQVYVDKWGERILMQARAFGDL